MSEPVFLPLETKRLLLRPVLEGDLPALLNVNNNAEVNRHLPYAQWRNMEDAQAWLRRATALVATGSATQWVLVDKSSLQAIGSALVFRHEAGSARAELGYVLGREHWGKGLMFEALQALIQAAFTGQLWGAFEGAPLRRLEAEVNPVNLASCAVLQRLGFVQEGVLRQRWMAKGTVYDVAVFGLLNQQWQVASQS